MHEAVFVIPNGWAFWRSFFLGGEELILLTSKNKENQKMMEIVNMDEENIHIFRANWRISMKFSTKLFYDDVKSH